MSEEKTSQSIHRAMAERERDVSPEALEARLAPLPLRAVAEVLADLLKEMPPRQQRKVTRRLPWGGAARLAEALPYASDADLLSAIEDLDQRVRSGRFVTHVEYDPEERNHRGFGDDSWIEEMDALFDLAEAYALAGHDRTAVDAYRLLFGLVQVQSDGGSFLTTVFVDEALRTDLPAALKRYFRLLPHLLSGAELADEVADSLRRYRYLVDPLPAIHELYPEGGPVIDALEEWLLNPPAQPRGRPLPDFLDPVSSVLRDIYRHFRTPEALERLAGAHGPAHPWAYEDLAQALAAKGDWGAVMAWTERGLANEATVRSRHGEALAKLKAQAARALGNPQAELDSLWDAFRANPEAETYAALRRAALAQGRWERLSRRAIAHLTGLASPDADSNTRRWAGALLVNALLAEGEHARALALATSPPADDEDEDEDDEWRQPRSYPEERPGEDAVVDYLVHSVARGQDAAALGATFPELAARLRKPGDFMAHLRDQLFGEPLPEPERDEQVDLAAGLLRRRIAAIAEGKLGGYYDAAARAARLVVDLYRVQEQPEKAERFAADLHQRHSRLHAFRRALRQAGVAG